MNSVPIIELDLVAVFYLIVFAFSVAAYFYDRGVRSATRGLKKDSRRKV